MCLYDLMLDLKMKVVWLDAWPQNESGSLWPIFHGSVILTYTHILKTMCCINMIPWAYEWIWLDVWLQSKSGSLWHISWFSWLYPRHTKYVEGYTVFSLPELAQGELLGYRDVRRTCGRPSVNCLACIHSRGNSFDLKFTKLCQYVNLYNI